MSRKGHGRREIVQAGALIVIGALAVGHGGCARGKITPDGCRWGARRPEVYTFYGSTTEVADKLGRFDMKLAERNSYMCMVESADSAELVLYRRSRTDQWQAWRWKGTVADARKIREEEENRILAGGGKVCLGVEAQGLLESWTASKEETVKSPATASDAFGDVFHNYRETSYIRASMFLLC